MEDKFPYRGPASRDTRFLVHGRRLFRDPSPGEFQESASRNISFSVLEKQPFRARTCELKEIKEREEEGKKMKGAD